MAEEDKSPGIWSGYKLGLGIALASVTVGAVGWLIKKAIAATKKENENEDSREQEGQTE